MKYTKHKSIVNLHKEDSPMVISPLKKKRRRPMSFMAFSSFARCNLFSQATPQNPNSSSPSPLPFSEQDALNPKISKPAKQIVYSSDDSEEDEEYQEEEETVEVDFEFFDPKPSDFHGSKLLLQRYLDAFQWDLSGFVDLILAQSTVGTVVKSADSDNDSAENDDEGELFALISALNLRRYFEHRCIKELKQYLVSVCKDSSTKDKLKQLLEERDKYLGLLVCERFVNCPYPLVLKLYDALFDEISWATEDEPTPELCDSYRFNNYLLVTKFFVNNSAPQQRNTKRKADQDEQPVIYVKEEDEIFHEVSSWSFTFELSADKPAPSDLKNYKKMGLVMAIKAEDISKFRDKFKSLVEG